MKLIVTQPWLGQYTITITLQDKDVVFLNSLYVPTAIVSLSPTWGTLGIKLPPELPRSRGRISGTLLSQQLFADLLVFAYTSPNHTFSIGDISGRSMTELLQRVRTSAREFKEQLQKHMTLMDINVKMRK